MRFPETDFGLRDFFLVVSFGGAEDGEHYVHEGGVGVVVGLPETVDYGIEYIFASLRKMRCCIEESRYFLDLWKVQY